MADQRITVLNDEIREHEDWLRAHPNHPADDKVPVRLSMICKTIKRDELMKEVLNEIVNNENQI